MRRNQQRAASKIIPRPLNGDGIAEGGDVDFLE